MKEPREVEKNGRAKWLVDMREFDAGRRYFDTLSAARRFQQSMLNEQAEHGRLAFDLPPETRRRYLALDTRAVALGTTLEEALAWYAKTHRAVSDKAVSEAVEECIDAKRKAGRRPRYVSQLGGTLRAFAGFDGNGSKRCMDLDLGVIEKWLIHLGISPETRIGYISRLSAFMEFCLKRGWVTENPTPRLEQITVSRKRPGILTPAQSKALMDACYRKDRRLVPWVALCLFCGVRSSSEAIRLTWEKINLTAGYVEIDEVASKTRERRLIKLQPNALAWLRIGGDLPVLNLDERFARVKVEAGFSARSHRKRGKRVGHDGDPWPRNAMRHSFCSYCLPIFGELKESEWAGHSPQIAISRYRELVTEEAAREFWGIYPE